MITVVPVLPSNSATASEEEVVQSLKLQNCDVLSNLDFKLSHLLEKERGVIKELVEEFLTFFQMFLEEQLQLHMMLMSVQLALSSNIHTE